MTTEKRLTYWAGAHALDLRQIKRTIRTIRLIKGHTSPADFEYEKDSLCYWIEQARRSRREVRNLKNSLA